METLESKKQTFVIGEAFQHRSENCVKLWLEDVFMSRVLEDVKRRTLAIEFKNKVSEYILPKDMNDTAIQKAKKSKRLSVNEFFQLLYLLIVEPNLGKELLNFELNKKSKAYFFHLELVSGESAAVRIRWDGGDDEWSIEAHKWDPAKRPWRKGFIFLFIPIPKKK